MTNLSEPIISSSRSLLSKVQFCKVASRKDVPGHGGGGTGRLRQSKWKKLLKDFGGCHENRLIESFEMSPHLIGLG